jgi:hypothetical protein
MLISKHQNKNNLAQSLPEELRMEVNYGSKLLTAASK